jgi:hypothetical protein
MPESTNTTTAGAGEQNNDGQAQDGSKGFEAITSQEDLDRILTQRLARERGKFADYEDLKAKAAKLADLENASKSEAERTAERIASLEKAAAEASAKALRAEVANAKGVPAALLTGSTLEELEAAADALIAFRGTPNTPKPDPSQGAKGKQGAGSAAEQFARFFEDNLNT